MALAWKKNVKEAVRWYRLAADQGDPRAQTSLGVMYKNGTGVIKNVKETAHLYEMAADQGYARAQYNLGCFYEYGTGVRKDVRQAARLYKLSADQGYYHAQNNLGFCYHMGIGVPRDFKEAVRLYRLACEHGYADAQVNLGLCYEYGTGVEPDPRRAARYYKTAADQGFANAQYYLGTCYEIGTGVSQNVFTAARWYRLAAEQGHIRAQDYLGYLESTVLLSKDNTQKDSDPNEEPGMSLRRDKSLFSITQVSISDEAPSQYKSYDAKKLVATSAYSAKKLITVCVLGGFDDCAVQSSLLLSGIFTIYQLFAGIFLGASFVVIMSKSLGKFKCIVSCIEKIPLFCVIYTLAIFTLVSTLME